MRTTWRKRTLIVLALGGLVLGTAACGDDDEDAAETGEDTSEETTTTAADDDEDAASGDVVEVTARDYEFEGVPDTVAAGTTFSLTTEEGGEPHELVILAKPAGETRSVDELIELPQEEIEALFAGEPALVAVALPGETDTQIPVGDGTVTAPGNYVFICGFPQGTTVEDVEAATGPLEGDTPPHFILGMRGEFTVN